MSNTEKNKFDVLPLSGTEYPDWALQAKMYLRAEGLSDTIEEGFTLPTGRTTSDIPKKASKAAFILLRHMEPSLRRHYQRQENPSIIWKSLSDRFNTDRERTELPILQDQWDKLKFFKFKTVTEYASELYRITTEMEHCGETITEKQKIQKTLSTFHPRDSNLSIQLQMENHKTFDTLVSIILRQEKHKGLIQKNYDERQIPNEPNGPKNGTTPESHYTQGNTKKGKRSRFDKKGSKQGKKFRQDNKKRSDTNCHSCGMRGHHAKACKTSRFHQQMYQKFKEQINNKSEDKSNENKMSFMTLADDNNGDESHCIEVLVNEKNTPSA